MAKHKNLQPWLDYFRMLQKHEESGYLLIHAEKHEAYVSQAALYVMAGVSFSTRELDHSQEMAHVLKSVSHLIRRLRVYVAWKSAGGDYLSYPFSVHIVKDGERPDPLHTIVLTSRRKWWALWRMMDDFEIISYDQGGRP